MTHHNQTEELITWFLNLPHDESIDNKVHSLKFESNIPWSTARRPKWPGKAQEGHLEEGKLQKPTKSMKSGKAKQNGKEELGKAQKSKKRSKSTQKLKRVRKAQKLYKRSKSTLHLTHSMQALPLK
jgi:hypothetical protein